MAPQLSAPSVCGRAAVGRTGIGWQSRDQAHRLCLARRPPSTASLSLRARAAPARHARADLAHAPAARAASHHTQPRKLPPQLAPPASEAAFWGRACAAMPRRARHAWGAAQCQQHGAPPGSRAPAALQPTCRQRPATARCGEHARRSCCGSAWRRSAARARGPCRRRSRRCRRRRRCRSRPRCSLACLRVHHHALKPAAQPC